MPLIDFDLPGYDIIEKIGSGGMASVYRAKQHTFQRNVALKILRQDLGEDSVFCERFVQESLIVAKLNHSHIVQVYDVGEYKNWFYVAMEFLSKGNLSETMANTYLSVEKSITIFSQILSALTYSHEKNIVHRDVKPDNIMFRDDGAAVLTDFGIAKDADSAMDLTQTGTIMGTPKYMSPEQIRGISVTPTSDLYSLGIMLFQMLTGKVPYTGATMVEVAYKHLNDPIPTLPNDIKKYQPLIDGLLAKNSDHRIQNGNHVQQLLNSIQKSTTPSTDEDATVILQKYTPPIVPNDVTKAETVKLIKKKSHLPMMVITGVFAVIAIAVLFGVYPRQPDTKATDRIPFDEQTSAEDAQNKSSTSKDVVLTERETITKETTTNEEPVALIENDTLSAADSLLHELQINGLLKSAEIDIREGRLIQPKDNNALDKYQRILAIDPTNAVAQTKINELTLQ